MTSIRGSFNLPPIKYLAISMQKIAVITAGATNYKPANGRLTGCQANALR